MVRNMMRTDPRMSGNPMMQQALRVLESDPGMIERMLGDPNVASAIANATTSTTGGSVVDPFAGGPEAMRAQMDRFEALSRRYGGGGGGFNVGGGRGVPPVATAPTGTDGGRRTTSNGGGNVGSMIGTGQNDAEDGGMTEEEMIAEAIARSLRDT
jgi:hypothetical protein